MSDRAKKILRSLRTAVIKLLAAAPVIAFFVWYIYMAIYRVDELDRILSQPFIKIPVIIIGVVCGAILLAVGLLIAVIVIKEMIKQYKDGVL